MEEILGKHCSPIEVARVNDQVIKLSYIDGEFHWHKHTNQDELFYILKGKLIIQLKDQPDITLFEGQMAVISKGVEHCPKSTEPSFVLLFEPFKLQTHGD
jgi:quercetin dioxygenase-like cupin family protein